MSEITKIRAKGTLEDYDPQGTHANTIYLVDGTEQVLYNGHNLNNSKYIEQTIKRLEERINALEDKTPDVAPIYVLGHISGSDWGNPTTDVPLVFDGTSYVGNVTVTEGYTNNSQSVGTFCITTDVSKPDEQRTYYCPGTSGDVVIRSYNSPYTVNRVVGSQRKGWELPAGAYTFSVNLNYMQIKIYQGFNQEPDW